MTQAVAIAKQLPGTPVKLLWTREEDMTHGHYHPITKCKLTGGLDDEGNLTSLHVCISGQSILAAVNPAWMKNGVDTFVFQGLLPDGTEALRPADDSAPFSALAFKVVSTPETRLTYLRVYSGRMEKGAMALNATNGKTERIARIFRMHADKREELKEEMRKMRAQARDAARADARSAGSGVQQVGVLPGHVHGHGALGGGGLGLGEHDLGDHQRRGCAHHARGHEVAGVDAVAHVGGEHATGDRGEAAGHDRGELGFGHAVDVRLDHQRRLGQVHELLELGRLDPHDRARRFDRLRDGRSRRRGPACPCRTRRFRICRLSCRY